MKIISNKSRPNISKDEVYRGRVRKVWKTRSHRENHFLDCRIGNLAAVNAYFSSFTADDWANRAKERGIPAELQAPDLFTPKEFHAGSAPARDGGLYGDKLSDINEGALGSPAVRSEPAPAGGLYGDSLANLNKGSWR